MDRPKQSWRHSISQIVASLLACSLNFQLGICMAFATILLPPELLVEPLGSENISVIQKTEYLTNQTGDDIVFTKEEASWITSILPLAATIGSAVSGLVIDRWGRKITLIVMGLTYIVGWGLTIFLSSNIAIPLLYATRTMFGIMNGCVAANLVYATEVSHPSIRASVLAGSSVCTSLGLMLAAILGYYITWRGVAVLAAVTSVVSTIGILFIPETPQWLSRNIKDDEERRTKLRKSLAWLFTDLTILEEEFVRYDVKVQSMEMPQLPSATTPSKTTEKSLDNNKSKLWKAIILLTTLFFFQDACGGYIVIFYGVQIFEATGSQSFDGWACMMVLSTIRLVMSLAATVQYFGRKTLLLSSSFGMAVMILSASLWLHLKGPSLGPVILVLLYITISSWGVFLVPWSIVGELLPGKYRGTVSGYIICIKHVFMFVILKICINIFDAVGIANLYLIFGGFSILMTIFVYVWIPETRGRSLEEIQADL